MFLQCLPFSSNHMLGKCSYPLIPDLVGLRDLNKNLLSTKDTVFLPLFEDTWNPPQDGLQNGTIIVENC